MEFADYRPEEPRQGLSTAISVREALPDELAACARLIVSRAGGDVEERRSRLQADLENPNSYVAAAVSGAEVIGYGGVIHHELTPEHPPGTAPTGYYLIGLIVAADWRRHGIGELLTLDRMRWTADRADTIWYFANHANLAIQDLHQSLGFEEVTRDFTFPGAPLQPGTAVLLRAQLGG